MSLSAGASLGPYQIVAPLGSGGMGEVYRAKDARLNRDVAIKVLAPHMAADTTALVRFEREAQALAALSHPGIVAIYDVGRHEDSAYVVMEFLEGETLRARLASGPIGIRKSLDCAIQIAYALAAAHERAIVHRDLKPENVFLCADGRLKLLDFGIVQLASASAAMSAETMVVAQPRATAPNMMVGTVGYMAPEQAQRINPETGALAGTPIRLAPEVLQNPITGWVAADVSRNSVLVWRAPGVDEVQFESVDREGRTIGRIGQPDAYTNFDISPDGSRIVTTRRRGESASTLFLVDLGRNLTTPISDQANTTAISDPTWSPDGEQIAHRRGPSLVARNVFGGEERVLADWAGYPDSWSRDGQHLIVGRPQGTDYQLWSVAVDGSGSAIPLVQGLSFADEPRFSPDGKWVVFHAAVQAAPQVFAIRFPPTGERWQISTDGGVQPRWRSDGRELYYLDSDGQVMVVAMPDGDPTKARSPEPLFGLRLEPSTAFDHFAPLADGQRFIVRRPLRPGGRGYGAGARDRELARHDRGVNRGALTWSLTRRSWIRA